MRLTLLGGLLVVSALALSSPLYFGERMQRSYDAHVAAWLPPSAFDIRERRYEKGWFTSTATVRFAPRGPHCKPQCPELLLYTRLDHGPIPFGATEALGGSLQALDGVMTSSVDIGPLFRSGRMTPGLPPLMSYTRVHFSGDSSGRLEMPAFTQSLSADSEQFSLTSSGLLADVDSDDPLDARTQISATLDWPELEAEGRAGRSAMLAGLRGSFDGLLTPDGVSGLLTASLERARFIEPGASDAYGIDALAGTIETARSSSATDRQLVSGSLNLSADRLAVPDEAVGRTRVDLEFANLDAEALAGIRKRVTQAIAPDAQPDWLSVAAGLGAELALIAPNAPELLINELHTTTTRGVATISGRVAMQPLTPATTFDPAALLNALELELQLEVDEPVMRRWLADNLDAAAGPQRIDSLIADNLLQRQPDRQITTQIRFENARLWINGVQREDWPAVRAQLSRDAALADPADSAPADTAAEPAADPAAERASPQGTSEADRVSSPQADLIEPPASMTNAADQNAADQDAAADEPESSRPAPRPAP